MHIKHLSLYLLLIAASLLMPQSNLLAQLQTPADFLGRDVGTTFTHHHQIEAYARHIAENSPRAMRQVYGHSYQGREMALVVIASEENMQRIEEIRLNNLRMTGMEAGEPTLENAPSLVWLSYNVHGNEPSSSEAALLAMYTFADPSNAESAKWLENTVVIIDPVLNPDGRQRYVNNFTENHGRFTDSNPIAREHRGDWPSGRTNHYYFDLNRDWAWQTQQETQNRVAIYQQWMPHVHADYHEMGYNSPYFFAPAAEPFHLAITPFQKSFQKTIGENHVRHFEKEGWLYYTGQVFDLFYPSYGDTWPTFNGAIGMTYEQGGIRGGLSIVTMAGDTLTLNDRVAHHYTTSLSTVEVTAEHAADVVSNFKAYFDQARSSSTYEYKAYGIRADNNTDRLARLLGYLDKQNIVYGFASGNNRVQGYDYASGKESRIEVSSEDIIIPADQPKGTLVRVLFEPEAVLTDSVTYDITAWQAHYVYGLKGYASKSSIKWDADDFEARWSQRMLPAKDDANKVYAFISRWSSLNDAAFVAELLREGFSLRYAETEFTLNGEDFGRGSIIVTRAENRRTPNFEQRYRQIAKAHNRWFMSTETGFTENGADLGSGDIRLVEKPNIMLLADPDISQYNLGEIWHFFDREMGYPVTIVEADLFERISLSKFNVLILAEGYYRDLLDDSMKRISDWVSDGGTLIALGRANSYLAGKDGFALTYKEREETATEKSEHMDYDTYAERERNAISGSINGAVYPVKLDVTHPLAYGMESQYYSLKLSSSHYATSDRLWNVGVLQGEEPRSGFSGSEGRKGVDNSLSFGVQQKGSGKVVYLLDNVLYRAFWVNGKLLMANAVLFD